MIQNKNFNQSYKDIFLKQIEIRPLEVQECSDVCLCPICSLKIRKQTPKFLKTMSEPRVRKRRFSVDGFSDDFLIVCSMLQKSENSSRSLNVNIQTTAFLKDRDFHLLIYYDNGLQFIRQKIFFITELEKFFSQRKNDYIYEGIVEQILNGTHKKITRYEFYEMNDLVIQKIKHDISNYSLDRILAIARYQSGDTILLTQSEIHQLIQVSKSNACYDSLIHLQLYIHEDEKPIKQVSQNKRSDTDIKLIVYEYNLDRKLFEEILSDMAILTDASDRGQRMWQKEFNYSNQLLQSDRNQYYKYTCHKIVAYVECFHQQIIHSMKVEFIENNYKNVAISNITNLKYSKISQTKYVVKRVREPNEKFSFHQDFTKHQIMTQRQRIVSLKMQPHTQGIFDNIQHINLAAQVKEEQETQSDEAFKVLIQNKCDKTLTTLLKNKDYEQILQNFPHKLNSYKKKQEKPLTAREANNTPQKLTIKDYLIKYKEKRIKEYPFLKSITKKLFMERKQ